MAFTQTDIDALDALYAKGAQRMRNGNEEVQFRTVAEYTTLRARMLADVSGTSSAKFTVSYPTAERGL